MAGLDLGKQVGPLPLGAWIVVVAGGLGIAIYTNRQQVPEPETVDETGDVGVGPSGFTQLVPVQQPTENETGPQTNEEWARIAIDGLISRGYTAALVNRDRKSTRQNTSHYCTTRKQYTDGKKKKQ